MQSELAICRTIDCLHPLMRGPTEKLLERLEERAGELKSFRFHLFEGYRSPERQNYLLRQGTTRAKAWQSAHQFGLAADIVPQDLAGDWTWSAPESVWDILRAEAKRLGLDNSISWDRPHIEHPAFKDAKLVIRAR